LVEQAEELIEQLAPVGGSKLLVMLPRPDEYIGFAGRGFFAYDWPDVARTIGYSRCYEIVARPEVYRTLGNISVELQAVARLVVFATLSFAQADSIPIEELLACER